MDVLSDVLRVVRLSGAVFFTADFSSPWSLESPIPDMLASAVMPQAECIVLFHILVDGECVGGIGVSGSATKLWCTTAVTLFCPPKLGGPNGEDGPPVVRKVSVARTSMFVGKAFTSERNERAESTVAMVEPDAR